MTFFVGRGAGWAARVVGLSLLVASPVWADKPAGNQNAAAAEALFNEGRKLMTAKKFAEACPKLAESQRLDPASGTMINLGECYEKLGKTASAWAAFRDAASMASASGNAERERTARQRATALEAQLAKLAVMVSPELGSQGIEVKLDGTVVGAPMWGVPVPVDPGEHQIEAHGPRRKPWSQRLTVGPKEVKNVEVPALEAIQESRPEEPPKTPAAPAPSSTSTQATESPDAGSGRRLTGLIVAGVGVVGLGLGGYFGLAARSKNNDSASECDGNRCSARGVDLRDQALGNATISTVGVGVGLAALAGGLALYFTAPSSKSSSAWIAPSVAPRSSSLLLGGRF